MRAILILLAALAAACGSLHDRSECSASADCAAGSYCARTGDGNVCWPDAVAPAVSNVSVTCDRDPCLRSGVLHVEATVADDLELSGAEVTLDVGGPAIAMAPVGGGVWAADVPLASFPFEHFTHDVVATVTARDGARNEGSGAASAVAVTRLAWQRAFGAGLVHPAVALDGTVAIPANNGTVYLVAWDGEAVASVVVGSGAPQTMTAPLALGASTWIGGEDDFVYEVKKNGGGTWEAVQRSDDTGGPIRGSLALTSDDRVLAATESGFVYAVTSTGYKSGTALSPFSLGPVVDAGSIFVVSGGSLRRLRLNLGATEPDPAFASTIGLPVTTPLAFSDGVIITVSDGSDGLLKRVSAEGGDPANVATTAIPSGGVAIASDGSILVPELTKTLSRWDASGAPVASWQKPDLGGAARTPIVLDRTGTSFVISTAKGGVHGLRSDGTISWTGQFGTAALQPGNIYTPPGQPPDTVLSIAYFAGADGALHAVIVDGKLDGSAPWPKAFHDPQNTNRAGAQP